MLGKAFFIAVAVGSLVCAEAYAYVDPGSGLILWQLLASALAGGVLFFRKQLAGIFKRPKRSEATPPAKEKHEPKSAA